MIEIEFTEQEVEWLRYLLEDEAANEYVSKFGRLMMERIIAKLTK